MRYCKINNGFSLLELVVVGVIIAVLATLAIPQMKSGREKSLGNEAKANLKLIAAAEKIYKLEAGGVYYPPVSSTADITGINSNLKLSLNSKNWNYFIAGAVGGASYDARAESLTGSCKYYMNQTETSSQEASCPQ